jgi:hypothetical protein
LPYFVLYHTTDTDPFDKVSAKMSPQFWADTAPRDYGKNTALVLVPYHKLFVTSPQEAKEKPELGVFVEKARENQKQYHNMGGESNPRSFRWIKNQGYDVLIDDEGYAALYPERVKILGWPKNEKDEKRIRENNEISIPVPSLLELEQTNRILEKLKKRYYKAIYKIPKTIRSYPIVISTLNKKKNIPKRVLTIVESVVQ